MRKDYIMIQQFDWQDMQDAAAFRAWSAAKCRYAKAALSAAPVEIASLDSPGRSAVEELRARCSLSNYAVYQSDPDGRSPDQTAESMIRFAHAFGLIVAEDHRSAGAAGVVALETTAEAGKEGYIPYTPRALNWHTDGYYNRPDEPINAFVLHCYCPAAAGGENQIMDPEIAYMRLREENPDYVVALMHPETMTIPENREADGSVRPASVGPVFYADAASGRLQMRYTARTRSIEWRDDSLTKKASEWLRDWLAAGDPLMQSIRLEAGQGILNNNVLHNRTRFEDGPGPDQKRIILRVRFHNRIAEVSNGTT